DTGSTYHSGIGTLLTGVRWRFLDEETSGISVSTYPQYGFHPFFSSEDPAVAAPGNQLIFPIEIAREFGRFGVNPEVGYVLSTQSPDAIFYGLAFGYTVKKESELVWEFRGNSFVDGSGTGLLMNVGTNWGLSEKLGLLFSVGHTLETPDGQSAQLLSYLGVQLRL